MNINNFTEFYNLLKRCGLESTSMFSNFISTVDSYITICECDNPSLKSIKLQDSKSLYENIVSGPIASYVVTFKTKTQSSTLNFYSGGRLIKVY